MTTYLICFEDKFHHAKHYIGYCETGNLQSRMKTHYQSGGSKLLRAVKAAGIEWKLARFWCGTSRNFERRLKNKNAKKLCPICSKKAQKVTIKEEEYEY